MRSIKCTFGAALGVLALAAGVTLSGSAGPADAGRIARWISQLGSKKFQDREVAARELDAAGPTALPALQAAEHDADPEVRRRAECIATRIEKRIETARLLEPRRVHLRYDDTPLDEALADFARKTGFSLEGGSLTRKERITLDTGPTTFWEALDQFCQKAGLVERFAGLYTAPASSEVRVWNARAAGQVVIVASSNGMNTTTTADGPLHFAAGKPPRLPTYYAGAVRIRALAPEEAARSTRGGEATVMLEVVPQPKMGWHGMLDFNVERAADEHGQALTWIMETKTLPPEAVARGMANRALLEAEAERLRQLLDSRKVPLKFKLPDAPSKVLKELRGTLNAQIQTPIQPLITIDDVLKAAGKTVKGRDGRSITVSEISQDEDGDVKMRVVLEEPLAPGVTLNRRLVMRNRVVIRNGAVIGGGIMRENGVAGESKLVLLDTKGQSFGLEVNAYSMAIRGASTVQDLRITFRPHQSHQEPAKFVYSDRRLVNIEIPFVLKDVPLSGK